MRKLQEIKNRIADRRAAEILGAAQAPVKLTMAQSAAARYSAALPPKVKSSVKVLSSYPKSVYQPPIPGVKYAIPPELRTTPGVKYVEAIPQDVRVEPKSWMAKIAEAILPSGAKYAVPPAESVELPPLPGGAGSFASEVEEDAEEDFEDGGGDFSDEGGGEGGEEGGGEADPFWNALAEYLLAENLTQPRSPFGAFETAAIFDPRGGVADPYTQPVREEIFGDVLGAVLKKKLAAAKVVQPKGRSKSAPTWVISNPTAVRVTWDVDSQRTRFRFLDKPLPKRLEVQGYGRVEVDGRGIKFFIPPHSFPDARFTLFVDGQPFALPVHFLKVAGGRVERGQVESGDGL